MSDRKRHSRAEMSERRTEDVDILDGFVTLKYPSVDAVLEMQKLIGEGKQEDVAVKLILMCAVDENGEPLFSDEAQIRKDLSIEAFMQLSLACMKFIKPSAEAIAKN